MPEVHAATEGRLLPVRALRVGVGTRTNEGERSLFCGADNRTVYLVTLKIPRWYRVTQNERLAACAERRANTLLVNWYDYSHDHPAWFADDGFHLTATGQARYAVFIATRTS